MSTKDINKTIEQLIKEYKDSILTYEKIIKIFPRFINKTGGLL